MHKNCPAVDSSRAGIAHKFAVLALLVFQLTIVTGKKDRAEQPLSLNGYTNLDVDALRNITETKSQSSKTRSTLVLFHSYNSKAKGKEVTFLKNIPKHLTKSGLKVQLSMFNCNLSPEECGKLGIENYPTLSLFFHRNKVEYLGKKSFPLLLDWVQERTSIFALEVTHINELQLFVQEAQQEHKMGDKHFALVWFCGSVQEQGFTEFNRISREREYFETYLYSSYPKVWEALNCTRGDIYFFGRKGWSKYQQTSRKPYGLERFVLKQKYFLVNFLNFYNYARFCEDNTQMVVFIDKSMEEQNYRFLQNFALRYSKIAQNVSYYYISDEIKEGMSKRMVRRVDSLLGINGEDDKPTLRFAKVQGQSVHKYKFSGQFTISEVKAWLNQVLEGQGTSYLKSQAVKQHHKAFKR